MFKPPDNKTDRFKGVSLTPSLPLPHQPPILTPPPHLQAIHKLRKRLSCSAIDLPPDENTSPSASPTSSPSPEPLPPCEWFGGAFRRMASATKHEGGEGYRIAMEIERGPREEVWGHFTFYSTSTFELELTASRIRDFKEGRYG
ncbi:hypothetical protein GRF29_161g1336488 [Pseudopithomyces chartarum]|uniref:Uncharacterized protein n=1 Tax=Pseudopithomyces chartarum TaxID=1892770 RepID=A0AAN6LR29_9PLEO|nr:hypothetical protein GRF29_161g1336488 [Pseudopithomyces chartarum]